MSRLLELLRRLSEISALPAHTMTYVVISIWVAGAAGWTPAAAWWAANGGSATAFVQISIGIWLAYRAGGKITEAIGRKEESHVDATDSRP